MSYFQISFIESNCVRSPHGKLIYGFYDILQWPHDSNLTIQVLGHILLDFKDRLPEVLYLQLDNTSRENKNRFVLGFCALLVQNNVFKKVHSSVDVLLCIHKYHLSYTVQVRLNFLPVGHTHEDIDQFFSKVSHKLKKSNVETFQGMHY